MLVRPADSWNLVHTVHETTTVWSGVAGTDTYTHRHARSWNSCTLGKVSPTCCKFSQQDPDSSSVLAPRDWGRRWSWLAVCCGRMLCERLDSAQAVDSELLRVKDESENFSKLLSEVSTMWSPYIWPGCHFTTDTSDAITMPVASQQFRCETTMRFAQPFSSTQLLADSFSLVMAFYGHPHR